MKLIVVIGLVLLSVSSHARKRQQGRHANVRARGLPSQLHEVSESNDVQISRIVGSPHRRKNAVDDDASPTRRNPCDKVRCKAGSQCSLDTNNLPTCVCINECPDGLTVEDAVCGSNNNTYASECDLLRTKCTGSVNKRQRKKMRSLKISYLGPCKAFSPCRKKELKEYPNRMRVWLKNVFLEMYDIPKSEGGLTDKQRHYGRKVYSERERLQEFEEGTSHELLEKEFRKYYFIYKYPIHWKFADLDRRPQDKKLSRKELEPLRAPLIPMEHCTKVFFKKADKNRDKKISLEEWGLALGLESGDIDPSLLI